MCADFRPLFRDFRGFLRPCEAMRQVKKQQIKVKFWIWGPRTVYYNMTCDQIFFSQKSLHPTMQTPTVNFDDNAPTVKESGEIKYRYLDMQTVHSYPIATVLTCKNRGFVCCSSHSYSRGRRPANFELSSRKRKRKCEEILWHCLMKT